MKRMLVVTSMPRLAAGATSAMYSGTTNDAAPTPAPTTHRPSTMPVTVVDHACITAPTVKSRSAKSITRLRPRRSARTEESGEMRRAKSAVDEVMMDLSSEVRGRFESESSMDTRVADITPVSSLHHPRH